MRLEIDTAHGFHYAETVGAQVYRANFSMHSNMLNGQPDTSCASADILVGDMRKIDVRIMSAVRISNRDRVDLPDRSLV